MPIVFQQCLQVEAEVARRSVGIHAVHHRPSDGSVAQGVRDNLLTLETAFGDQAAKGFVHPFDRAALIFNRKFLSVLAPATQMAEQRRGQRDGWLALLRRADALSTPLPNSAVQIDISTPKCTLETGVENG